MSKATIVSLLPIELHEIKPGTYPGDFRIPAAKEGDFEILPIGDSVYYVQFVLDNRPPLKMTDTAEKTAESIVNDYITTVLGLGPDAKPGLFWVPEHLDKKALAVKYATQLATARAQQVKWFTNLVRIADDEWVKSGKMHRSISSLQRSASKFLGLEREWYIEPTTELGPIHCPACRTIVHPLAIVCEKCRAVLKPDEYKKLTFATA